MSKAQTNQQLSVVVNNTQYVLCAFGSDVDEAASNNDSNKTVISYIAPHVGAEPNITRDQWERMCIAFDAELHKIGSCSYPNYEYESKSLSMDTGDYAIEVYVDDNGDIKVSQTNW